LRAIAHAGYRDVHYLAKPGEQVELRSAPLEEVKPRR
jgi:hypothetical protein